MYRSKTYFQEALQIFVKNFMLSVLEQSTTDVLGNSIGGPLIRSNFQDRKCTLHLHQCAFQVNLLITGVMEASQRASQ